MKAPNFTGSKIIILIAVTLMLLPACSAPPAETKRPNQSPLIESVTYAQDTMANSEVQIECLAKDADGDNLTYQWSAEAGEIRGTGNTILWMPPGKMGTYPLKLLVTDGKGGVATENISIRVVTNADGTATPMVELKLKMGNSEIPVVYKQRIRNWFEVDILCIIEDAGSAGELLYTWSATGGEIKGKGLDEGRASRIRWKAPGVKGDYTISLTVKDSSGNEAKGQVIATVFCCGDS